MPLSPLARGESLSAWIFISAGSPVFVRGGGMDVQFAEQPAEGEMLLRRDVLIAEEDDEVLRQRAVELVHRPVGQRAGEVDAADFRADDRREPVDADRLVRRVRFGRLPIAGTLIDQQRAHGPGSMTRPAKLPSPSMVARMARAAQTGRSVGRAEAKPAPRGYFATML